MANPRAAISVVLDLGATIAETRIIWWRGRDVQRHGNVLVFIRTADGSPSQYRRRRDQGPARKFARQRSLLRAMNASPLEYIGFVDGDGIGKGGPADVIVAEGFSGNIALKAAEGTARPEYTDSCCAALHRPGVRR